MRVAYVERSAIEVRRRGGVEGVTGLVWREVKAPTVTAMPAPNCAEAIEAEGAVGSSALAVALVTFVRRTNPKKAAPLRSLIADEVVAPPMRAQVKGGKPT